MPLAIARGFNFIGREDTSILKLIRQLVEPFDCKQLFRPGHLLTPMRGFFYLGVLSNKAIVANKQKLVDWFPYMESVNRMTNVETSNIDPKALLSRKTKL